MRIIKHLRTVCQQFAPFYELQINKKLFVPTNFCTFAPLNETQKTAMTHKTALKIYEWASYLLIVGATLIYVFMKQQGVVLTMLVQVLAMFMRMMMERTRRRACEDEIDELQSDLRRLTQLYAEEKKKHKSE